MNNNPTSDAQRAANRANAQHSTGARTESGKAKVSLNALKTGLTGCTVVLPSEDAELYRTHIAGYEKELQPVGIQESHLVQSLADLRWRLNRIPGLELAICSYGRAEFADMFADSPEPTRAFLIELHVSNVYEKQLRNLRLHENRLARRREKEQAELRALQQERKAKEAKEKEEAGKTASKPPQPEPARTATAGPQNGFEFSNPPANPVSPSAPAAETPEIAVETAA
jgi:hypothetical protein